MKLLHKILLTAALFFALTAFSVSAESGSCGEGLGWSFDGSALSITGSGYMNNYTKDTPSPWADFSVKTVRVGDGVLSVGDYAFAGQTSLESITFNSGLLRIGERAFYKCTSLQTLALPNSVSEMGKSAFNGCSSLWKATLSQGLCEISASAFMNCTSLTWIALPSGITSVGKWAFLGDTALHSAYFEGDVPEVDSEAFLCTSKKFRIYCIIEEYPAWGDSELIDRYVAYPYAIPERIIVYLNNRAMDFDSVPVIADGRTLVPFRNIFNAFGATVKWDEDSYTVTAEREDMTMQLTIGEKIMYINGQPIELDCSAKIVDDRTMVPLRAVSVPLGADITWNESERAVYITAD